MRLANRRAGESLSLRLLLIVHLAVAACGGASALLAAPVTGVGVMGDSVADEYRFPQFLPPGGDRRAERNFVELLSDLRGVNFGDFSAVTRGAPRNQGFAFNWAEDGSRSADLIAKGQHTGLAQQVSQGQANLAWIWIGGNDFRDLFTPEIITGSDPAAAIQNTVVTLATNVNVAMQTLLAANPALNIVVANVPDLRSTPALKSFIASTPGLDQFAAGVDQGIQAYNAQLKSIADASNRIAIADAYATSKAAVAGEPVQVDFLTLDTNVPGNGADHYFVDALHPGTAASGILANLFIDSSNAEFNTGLTRLSDHEIAQAAIPLPSAAWSGIIGLGAAAIVAKRRRLAA